MDINRVSNVIVLAALVMIIVGAFILGRRSVDVPDNRQETRIDTIAIEKPVPYKEEVIRIIRVPLVIATTPNDSIATTPNDSIIISKQDTIYTNAPIIRKEYKDSTYRAIISGIALGGVEPTLESIDVYHKVKTQVIETPTPLIRPYISMCGGNDLVGIGGGITIKQKVDFGAKYLRVDNKNHFMIECNYRF